MHLKDYPHINKEYFTIELTELTECYIFLSTYPHFVDNLWIS